MFSRTNRLSSSRDIQRTLKAGLRAKTKLFSIYVAQSGGASMRFVCVVGKKVHKSSVVRHAIQRRIRAACRKIQFPDNWYRDVVLLALSSEIQTMSIEDIASDIQYGLQGIR